MSWLYRFFTKSDNEQVVTITAPAIQLTGAATVTGALAQTGNLAVTGNAYVSSTARIGGAAIYLGAGTVGITWGAITAKPNVDGLAGFDKCSLYIGGTSGLYVKTDYASTSWASYDLAD